MLLDFPAASLMCEIEGQEAVSLPLNGCTQAEIFDRLFDYLINHGFGQALPAGKIISNGFGLGSQGITLWFVGTVVDERQFHMNFGFSPRREGMDQPYLYAYAYSYPEGDIVPALPKGARWHTQGWKGMVQPYEVIAAHSNSARFVEASCAKIYAAFLAVKGK